MKKISLIAILAVLAAPAFAGDSYFVGSFGRSSAKVDQGAMDADLISAGAKNLSSSSDETDTAFKFLAGYQYNQYLGVEGGYIDFGKAKYSASATQGTAKADIKATGWNISAVGTLPVNDSFAVFAKVGAVYAKVEASASVSVPALGNFSGSDSATKWKAAYGIGATYNINKQIGVRAEFEQFRKLGDESKTGESNVDVISLGLTYKY